MLRTQLQPAHILSMIIVVLIIVASASGLGINNLYRDNFLVTSGWYGNDLVSLLIAAPALIAALVLSIRGSHAAQLVWLGLLAYTFYNYAFYLFGAAFNSLFLVYAALFTLSGLALIFGLVSLDVNGIRVKFRSNTPVKWISAYMLLVVVFMGGFWIALSLGYVFTGQIPQIIVELGIHTNLIAALDLSIMVPLGLLGSLMLWKRNAWGYVLAAIWNVKGITYMMAMMATTLSAFQAGALEDLSQLSLWGIIGLGCLTASLFLFVNLERSS